MHDWVPRFTKLRLLAVILSAVAAIVVGASRITIVKEVAPVRTKIVRVPVPSAQARTGEMTDEQCLALRKGVSKTEIEDRYGLPKGGDPSDESVGWLHYPIKHGGPYRDCFLSFDNGALSSASYDVPLH